MQRNPNTSTSTWRYRSFSAAVAALSLMATIASAKAHDAFAPIAGPAFVIDGDTVDIAGTRIRLRGLDAPEMAHPGGVQAREAMQAIIGESRLVCKPDGTKTHKRIVATCFLAGERDIAVELIRQGFALDCAHFSHGAYAVYETAAAKLSIMRASYCRTRVRQ